MIPVRNVYYLLCYAWDGLEDARSVDTTGIDQFHRLEDLFGAVLARGVLRIARRGLDQSYMPYREELAAIRGKIELTDSIRRTSLVRNRIVCSFDELSADVLHNQILASTLALLCRHAELDPAVRRDVRLALGRMQGVSQRPLTRQLFARVHLDRNRRAYRFLLHVCWLLHEACLVDPASGRTQFIEVDLERLVMWQVFERFVERFYAKEQGVYRTHGQSRIHWWELMISGAASERRVPAMIADLVLEGPQRRIVLDTKYYRGGGAKGPGGRLRSGHLYQVFAYVLNRQRARPDGPLHEGILLYPTVGKEVRVDFRTHGHRLQARSLDLSRPWREIHEQLLQLVA